MDEVEKNTTTTPMDSERTTIEIGLCPVFGKRFSLFIDCVKNIAYRHTGSGEWEQVYLNIRAFSRELYSIISSWEERMVDRTIFDGLIYRVKVVIRGEAYEYYGQNKFPQNFDDFLGLLWEYKLR